MPNETMQAIQAHDYGGPGVLVLERSPRPEPNADQMLIRLKAAASTLWIGNGASS